MTQVTSATTPAASAPRFSGHETFAFRYAWLPKAYRALRKNPAAFLDEDAAMVEMGLGKNMVRSLRFWVEAVGVARPGKARALELTEFGHAIFKKNGFDPYLEDVRTLWLLHWNLSSRHDGALFAWRHLLNHWPYPELTRSEALDEFMRESSALGYSHSAVTLAQHLDAFLHTYCPTRSMSVGVEDSLDGPLVGLDLLQASGERRARDGKWEVVFTFRREPKQDISMPLFSYCLADFWNRFRPNEQTLTLREISVGSCSPGQVFKLPEDDVRTRLEQYSPRSKQPFTYQASAVQGLLFRASRHQAPALEDVYAGER